MTRWKGWNAIDAHAFGGLTAGGLDFRIDVERFDKNHSTDGTCENARAARRQCCSRMRFIDCGHKMGGVCSGLVMDGRWKAEAKEARGTRDKTVWR